MQQKITRYHFMDGMRSILMMLGIVLHSAQVYKPGKTWVVVNEESLTFAGQLIAFISPFRMPTFFIISGFFCLLTLAKYDTKTFIDTKIKRILVPFLSTLLTLNLLQIGIVHYIDASSPSIVDAVVSGEFVYHLWFLINLVVYFFLAVLLHCYAKAPLAQLGGGINAVLSRLAMPVILLIMPGFSIAIMALNKVGVPVYGAIYIIDFYSILEYLPFFIFGLFLFADNQLLNRFSQLHGAISVVFIVLLVLLKMTFSGSEFSHVLINKYAEAAISWFSASLVFYLFYRFFNKPSEFWRTLSDAAYSVYLFHHLTVVIIAIVLINLGVIPYVGLALLIVLTVACTLLLHLKVIQSTPWLKLLFNGK